MESTIAKTTRRRGKAPVNECDLRDDLKSTRQWSAAMPLCSCADCVRRGYVSPRAARRMQRLAAATFEAASRGPRGLSSSVEEVRYKLLETQCWRACPKPTRLTTQHIEEVLAMTRGNIEEAARLLVDFRGRTSKRVSLGQASNISMDGACCVCWDEDNNTSIEPCGHLICHRCFDKIRQSETNIRQTCPYCRTPITGARPVVLEGPDDGLNAVVTSLGVLTAIDDEEEIEEIDIGEARRVSVAEQDSRCH